MLIKNPVIAYSVNSYLFITGVWIYNPLIGLNKFKPIVICQYKQNLNLFPFKPIYSLDINPIFNQPRLKRLFLKPIIKAQIAMKRSRYFCRVLRENNVLLLHSHFGDEAFRNLRVKKKLGIPMITTFYGIDVSKLAKKNIWKYRYKKLFREGELFLTEGNYMKKSLIELGCPEEKVVVQHLGIDLNKIKFLRREIKDSENIKILVAGTFREKKGIPYALEAFAMIGQKYKNIELTLVGDSNGTPREELEKRKIFNIIAKHNLYNSVRILGYQSYDVFYKELYKHHIFLSPSVNASDGDSEGGAPVSIIEASASGMPVISTFHCDIPEIILDKKSGYLVKERDVDALTTVLENLAEHPESWASIGLAGRQHIEQEYNLTKQVKKLENLYSQFI